MLIYEFGFIGVVRDTDASCSCSALHVSVASTPLKIFNFILNHNIYPPQHLVNLCTVDSGCLTISLGG